MPIENWIQSSSLDAYQVFLLPIYFILTTILFRYYLNTTWKNAFGIMLGNMLVNAILIFLRSHTVPYFTTFQYLYTTSVLCTLITALILRIFYRWATNSLTNEELTPGLTGLQAWLGWPNMALCVAIALSVAVMASWSNNNEFIAFLTSFFISVCAFSQYPLFNTMIRSKNSSDQEEDLSQARLKILDLLESGKISAEECMELLKAVKPSQPSME